MDEQLKTLAVKVGLSPLSGGALICEKASRRLSQLENALVKLIDAVDAGDRPAINNALLVGKGLTF